MHAPTPATTGAPSTPDPTTIQVAEVAEQVGLARLALDLGYPVTAADILGSAHRALLDLAVTQ